MQSSEDHHPIEALPFIDFVKYGQLVESSAGDDSEQVFTKASIEEFASRVNPSMIIGPAVDAVISKFCEMIHVDQASIEDSALSEMKDKVLEVIGQALSGGTPVAVIHYPTTDTYFILVVAMPHAPESFTLGGIVGSLKSVAKSLAKHLTAQGMSLIPIKIDSGKIEVDLSAKALSQLAIAVLLSDLDFDTLYPISMKSGWI